MPDSISNILLGLARQIKSLLGNNLSKVIVYGSYARGDYRENSDVDVMIPVMVVPLEILQISLDWLSISIFAISIYYIKVYTLFMRELPLREQLQQPP